MTVYKHFIQVAHIVLCSFVGLASGGVYAQGVGVDYARFLPWSYTDGFKRGLEVTLSGKARVDSQDVEVSAFIAQQAGARSSFAGKDWIEVKLSASVKFGPEETEISQIQLYDPRTQLQAFEIDLREHTIKSYEWTALPKTLRSGEVKQVARTQEKDKDEKVLSEGTISYRLTVHTLGYEFCRIEVTREVESDDEKSIEDCDQFSRGGRISGSRVVLKLDEDTTVELTGKLKLN